MTFASIPPTALLRHDDPRPVEAWNLGAPSPWLIICDHAGRAVPQGLNRLGLADAEFERHIAWDIGAGALSRRLGRDLGAGVIRQAYSRLVIDCNRGLDAADLIAEVSDGSAVPGNQGLTERQRQARIDAVHAPYHATIQAAVDERVAAGAQTLLLLVHSFTPRMADLDRPWRFGVLHDGASKLSDIALEELRREDDAVGDNEPYAMDGVDYTAPRHAIARGIEYLELEIRQDLIADDAGQARVGELLARVLRRCEARLAG